MKKTFYAASAAVMAAAMAPATQAAVINPIDSVPLNSLHTDSFNAASVLGFVEYFSFALNSNYDVSVVGAASGNNTIKFQSLAIASWNGSDPFGGLSYAPVPFSVFGGGKFLDALFSAGAGSYVLRFVGTGSGSFGGDISIASIPEPASWALMIAGIAVVGTVLRRRVAQARVSFS